jgi:hypothetical protein
MYKSNTKILGTLNNNKIKKSYSKKIKYGVLIEDTQKKLKNIFNNS